MDPRNDGSSSSDEEEVPGPTEEELDAIFAEFHEILSEMEKEREEQEFERWLAGWKVLTDAGEAWLRELGYTDETVYTECFEEIIPGEEVDSDVEIIQLPDEETEEEEDEDEDDDEDDGDVGGYGGSGGYGGGDGGGGGSGWGGSGGGTTGVEGFCID